MGKYQGNGGEAGSLRHGFERTGERMKEAGERIESAYEDVRERMSEVGGRVGGMVREHPMMAILAGVGIGFLVGRLLSRD
jgi:ElaB/YqjD/DUF883 family membrane-anchored ribosome-binding protein